MRDSITLIFCSLTGAVLIYVPFLLFIFTTNWWYLVLVLLVTYPAYRLSNYLLKHFEKGE